jgi:hypothetical protein
MLAANDARIAFKFCFAGTRSGAAVAGSSEPPDGEDENENKGEQRLTRFRISTELQ